MTEWRIDLPWTSPPLRDNDRDHHMAKARKVAEVRDQVGWLARAAKLPQGIAGAVISLHWQPSTNRRRDSLSIAPSLKPAIDAIVTDYGLCDDDDIDHVIPQCRVYRYDKSKPAGCWLTIQEWQP